MTDYNTIDKHAFATSNNSTDVGDLEETDYSSIGTYDLTGGYGYTSAGEDNRRKIQRFSFTTDGNSTEVGQFTKDMHDQSCGASGKAHGYAASSAGIDKHTYSSSVSTSGVGNLTTNRSNVAGTQG